MRELAKFPSGLPLEVFVHGALCVAYSGQCLTSESLGQRSANRGECAQACRMPYEIVVDGKVQDLGDKRYLLSPQDLAAVREIPEFIRLGVASFKIEGRLKTPEYVTAVTSVYRKAIDDALAQQTRETPEADWYKLEMTFSRGLFSGWMHGVDHQRLVNATYGKKRGVLAGRVREAVATTSSSTQKFPCMWAKGSFLKMPPTPMRNKAAAFMKCAAIASISSTATLTRQKFRPAPASGKPAIPPWNAI